MNAIQRGHEVVWYTFNINLNIKDNKCIKKVSNYVRIDFSQYLTYNYVLAVNKHIPTVLS